MNSTNNDCNTDGLMCSATQLCFGKPRKPLRHILVLVYLQYWRV